MRHIITALIFCATAYAQPGPGSRIYLDGMDADTQGFMVAEIAKQELPLVITRDEDSADYVLMGVSQVAKRGWKRAVLGGEPDTGTAQLYDRKTQDLVWSDSVGGRSFMKGDFKSQKRIAKKLVQSLKKEFFGND